MTSPAETTGSSLAPEPARLDFAVGMGGASGSLAAIAFGDPGRPVEGLFLHANGFNALTYRAMLSRAAPVIHMVAIDQDGHGRSAQRRSADGRTDWLDLRDDLIEVIDSLATPPLLLAGH